MISFRNGEGCTWFSRLYVDHGETATLTSAKHKSEAGVHLTDAGEIVLAYRRGEITAIGAVGRLVQLGRTPRQARALLAIQSLPEATPPMLPHILYSTWMSVLYRSGHYQLNRRNAAMTVWHELANSPITETSGHLLLWRGDWADEDSNPTGVMVGCFQEGSPDEEHFNVADFVRPCDVAYALGRTSSSTDNLNPSPEATR